MTAFDTGLKKSTAEVLRDLLHSYPSGRVVIRDPKDLSTGWRVFFHQGQINFAESIVGNRERLCYLLERCTPKLDEFWPHTTLSEYDFLCQLWQAGNITHAQLKDLLTALTQEALIHALAIPYPQYQFESNGQVDPIVLCTSLWNLVLPIEEAVNQWILLSAEIPSPFARPYISNEDQFIEYADYVSDKLPDITQFTQALGQDHCLYQLAHILGIKVGDLAVALHPLIKLGALGMHPYARGQLLTRPRIACINQSKPIQRYVTQVLEPSGYEVMGLSDSIRALPALLKRPPILALIDAELPHVDGYQLCRMVHRREQLQDLPVIITAPQRGMCDLFRTRLSGAMACLGTPFHHQELLALVQQATAILPLEQQRQLRSLPIH